MNPMLSLQWEQIRRTLEHLAGGTGNCSLKLIYGRNRCSSGSTCCLSATTGSCSPWEEVGSWGAEFAALHLHLSFLLEHKGHPCEWLELHECFTKLRHLQKLSFLGVGLFCPSWKAGPDGEKVRLVSGSRHPAWIEWQGTIPHPIQVLCFIQKLQ